MPLSKKPPIDQALEYRRLEWHIKASKMHMGYAMDAAKKLRIAKKVLYVTRPVNMWWPQSIVKYFTQIEYRLKHEQRRDATDSTK